MKITVSINLGGYSFNIDEDAYAELKRYLKNLELHFAGEESSSEILSDIETRMAEIFRTKLTTYKQVINIEDVHQVIQFWELLKIFPMTKAHQPAINFHLRVITGCTAIPITVLSVVFVPAWEPTGISNLACQGDILYTLAMMGASVY